MSQQEEIIEEKEEEEEEESRKPDCSFSLFLNKFFHHIDRGSHLRSEVLCGIVIFLISICVLFTNMQIIGQLILGDLSLSTSPNDPASIEAVTRYVALYESSLIVSFLSSLLIGFLVNLPFVQISTMGLSVSIIGFFGLKSGLSYQNVLFVSWIASILTAIITGVPAIRRFFLKGLPKPLLRVLPCFYGALLLFTGVKLSGFFSESGYSTGSLANGSLALTSFSVSSLSGITLLAFVSAIISFFAYFLLRSSKAKHPLSMSFIIGLSIFLGVGLIKTFIGGFSTTDGDSLINFGRIWLVAGSQASDKTPFGDSYFSYSQSGFSYILSNIPSLFSEGADFSAYSGNAFLFVLSSVIAMVLFNLVDASAVIESCKEGLSEGRETPVDLEAKESKRLYWISSGMNFLAPFLGVGAITTSKVSVLSAEDKAKSGISSIVAALGYLISIFVMAFPALLASSTYLVTSMNEFNYFAYGNGGMVYLIQGLRFGLADAFLCLIGIIMIEKGITLLKEEERNYLLSSAAFFLALVFSSLMVGLFASSLLYLLISLFDGKREEGEGYFATLFKNVKNNLKQTEIPVVAVSLLSLLGCFASM